MMSNWHGVYYIWIFQKVPSERRNIKRERESRSDCNSLVIYCGLMSDAKGVSAGVSLDGRPPIHFTHSLTLLNVHPYRLCIIPTTTILYRGVLVDSRQTADCRLQNTEYRLTWRSIVWACVLVPDQRGLLNCIFLNCICVLSRFKNSPLSTIL